MNTLPVHQLARAIRSEYLDMPGLSLTCEQVRRLYSLDDLTSEAILAALIDVRFLARSDEGRYVRAKPSGDKLAQRPDLRFRAA